MTTERRQAGCRLVQFPECPPDASVIIGPDWRYRTLNHAAERSLGRTDLVGRVVWDEFPTIVDVPIGTALRYVMQTRQPYSSRELSLLAGHDLITNVTPEPDGSISVAYRVVPHGARQQEPQYGT